MELYVARKFFKDTYTIGRFYCEDMFLCSSLEDPIRDLKDLNNDKDFDDTGEGKIYGETAIPAGRYQVVVNFSPKLGRRLPLLIKVPGFTGIRIHSLKTAKGTEGCIGVGENKKLGQLVNGPYWEDYIIKIIDESIERGERVYITIKS